MNNSSSSSTFPQNKTIHGMQPMANKIKTDPKNPIEPSLPAFWICSVKGCLKSSTQPCIHQLNCQLQSPLPAFWICPVKGCGKSFIQPCEIKLHCLSHKGPFDCNQCEESFLEISCLEEHVERHKTEKPRIKYIPNQNICPVDWCGLIFNQPYELIIHCQKHTDHKSFACNQCEENFVLKGRLKEHLKKHEIDSRTCSVNGCKRIFKSKYKLEIHSRTHTVKKPFECNQCGKKFTTKHILNTHSKLHLKKKWEPEECINQKCGTEKMHISKSLIQRVLKSCQKRYESKM